MMWIWILAGIVVVGVVLVWWWRVTGPDDLDDDLLEALWRIS